MTEAEKMLFDRPDEMRRWKGDDAVEVAAERVTAKALDSAGLKASDIDFIIASNIGGKYNAPYVGTWIHHKLGFREETPVLNIFNACASFIDGLNNAWHLVRAGEYKRILVVMVTAWDIKGEGLADPTSPLISIFGDGAGAAIVSSQNLKCEFISYYSRTWGYLYDHIFVKLRPAMHPELRETVKLQSELGNYLWVSEYCAVDWLKEMGPRIAIEGIEKAVKKVNLTIPDIDMVVFHQGPEHAVEDWIEGGVKGGISRDKFKHTYNNYGNVGNIDIGITLAELWEDGKIARNSIIALVGMAGGGHAPTMILKWSD
jgi:3-oxoacyl-[acyl-carrier-protein] synthase-3